MSQAAAVYANAQRRQIMSSDQIRRYCREQGAPAYVLDYLESVRRVMRYDRLDDDGTVYTWKTAGRIADDEGRALRTMRLARAWLRRSGVLLANVAVDAARAIWHRFGAGKRFDGGRHTVSAWNLAPIVGRDLSTPDKSQPDPEPEPEPTPLECTTVHPGNTSDLRESTPILLRELHTAHAVVNDSAPDEPPRPAAGQSAIDRAFARMGWKRKGRDGIG